MIDNLLAEDLEPQIDPNKDYLSELVGDGKKFKTVQDLAKGKYLSDTYIKTLEKTKDQLREDYLKLDADYKARAKLEELIDQLDKSKQQQSNNDDTKIVNDKKPEIDPQQIESLVDSRIKKNKVLEREQENFNKVKERLKEKFGVNYQAALNEQIENLELTVDYVNDLAKRSPTAFFNALRLDEQEKEDSFQTPPRSSQRRDSFEPKSGPKRTWTYYQELRKNSIMILEQPFKWKKITKLWALPLKMEIFIPENISIIKEN